ncbi:MAG: sulfur oxidation c-type cytochrome SoxA [Thiohalomonadaceae bacterium]
MKSVVSAVLLLLPLSLVAWDKPVSGYAYLPEQMQVMQDDEFENPGMYAVEEGSALFHAPGYNGQSCAGCHGDNGSRLDPKAIARYPLYSAEHQGPLTLQQRINDCRERHLDEFPLPYDDVELIALETYVRHLARGEKVNVDVSGPLKPWYDSGKVLYHTRIGQLDMSCHHCHDRYVDLRLRDQVLNQGHSNAFPAHRLQTGAISSLHGKFRDCYATLRALPYAVGSEEFIALEVYLNARGNGLPIETPGIRR